MHASRRDHKRESLALHAQASLADQHLTALEITEPNIQAAEHRKRVLSNLSVPGVIYMEVAYNHTVGQQYNPVAGLLSLNAAGS